MAADGFHFGAPRRARRPSLTPMIDVVFLLLVFFMLAARFGAEGALPVALAAPGAPTEWQGPPRLVEIGPENVRLNGLAVDEAGLAEALRPLMAGPEAPVLLRPVEGASLQRVVDVIGALSDAGLTALAVVE
ncbi:biopolymer transporter ExbD [Ostreiculturibacter nitratireducens]|uniref:ExbD/TolR family protein n=1 Tax=Ostreiculturibacter nitratireducens TaxID=3075226 RepID=UPI0031B58F72